MDEEFYVQLERINASLPPAYMYRLLESDIIDDDWEMAIEQGLVDDPRCDP